MTPRNDNMITNNSTKTKPRKNRVQKQSKKIHAKNYVCIYICWNKPLHLTEKRGVFQSKTNCWKVVIEHQLERRDQ